MGNIDHSRTTAFMPATVTTPRSLRGHPSRFILCGALLVLAFPAFGEPAPVAERVSKQNALFEEFYQTGLKNSPERATSFGDYRYNSQLGQYSLEEIARQHAETDDFLERLQAIPTRPAWRRQRPAQPSRYWSGSSSGAGINYELKNYEMPINQLGGAHTWLADLPL